MDPIPFERQVYPDDPFLFGVPAIVWLAPVVIVIWLWFEWQRRKDGD